MSSNLSSYLMRFGWHFVRHVREETTNEKKKPLMARTSKTKQNAFDENYRPCLIIIILMCTMNFLIYSDAHDLFSYFFLLN